MSSLFAKTYLIYTHFTRNRDGYFIVKTRTNIIKFTVNYSESILWKSRPHGLRLLPSMP